MKNIKNQYDYQAQDDAYVLSKYDEILSDKKRLNKAIKAAKSNASEYLEKANKYKKVASKKR